MPPSTPPRGNPAPTDTPRAVEPSRLLAGRYRLDELLASGGMAQVWRGTDEVLRRSVALKLLHAHLAADDTFVTRFRQEAVAAARLTHPGIVSIYDTCSDDGVEAIVMELVPGRTLRERLDDPTPIDPWQAAGLAAQVAEALDAAHRAGLVHRDVKPANVLLCGDGRVKVADFGIAKAVADADLTQPGSMVGTAKYLAPEQVLGEPVDPRTDIYGLGVVLYEMLCGRPPFAADTDAATALARLQRDPLRPRQVRPGVPKALEEVVLRAMARQPRDRFDSAADLRAALLAAGATPAADGDLTAALAAPVDATVAAAAPRGATAPASAGPPPGPSFRQTERSWLVPTVIVVLVALALGIAGLLIDRSGAGDLLGGVRDAIGGGQRSVDLPTTGARSFDPPCGASRCEGAQQGGDGRENDGDAGNVRDGDLATSWTTERYDDPDITALKPGVGIVLTLGSPAELRELVVTSPTDGWHATAYVAAADGRALGDWGDPLGAPAELAAGVNTIDLEGTSGQAVLLWITRAGADGRVEIQEAALRGIPIG